LTLLIGIKELIELLRTLHLQLKARSIKVTELEVRISNKEGMNFWKRLGFFPLRVVPRFYNAGEDALKMRKIKEED